ncbi:MAG TPA: dihydroneopterin aldolase [Gammaproteobacteria bacterium]|nr:dihydroneopterin aldolase [Gammaproteobacteria bacterium]
MDIVFIRDLRIDTVVGVYDWERRIRQTVILDLDMGTDIRRAAASDKIDDTLDYKTVAKRVSQYVSEQEFQLVETLAENVATIVLKEFKVPWVKIALHKPGAVSGSKSVGIIIERSRDA